MEYPEIDRYSSLDSPIHRLDPRVKIVAFLSLIFSVVLLSDLKLTLVGLSASIIFLLVSRLPFGFVLSHLRWVLLFIIPFLAIMPFTMQGTEIFQIYGIGMTREGLRFGLLVSIRALTAIMLIFPMVGTMRFDSTLKALEKLKVPNPLVQMLMFTYRYIFTFAEEFSRMRNAMTSKGFKLKTSLKTLKTIGKAIGMLFVRAYERAERVYQAMISRGYTGTPKSLDIFNIKPKDYIIGTLIVTLAITLQIYSIVV